MYKISREEVTEKKSFSIIAHLFKMLFTTFFLGILLLLLGGIYAAFYGDWTADFEKQALIMQLGVKVGLFAMGLSVLAMVVLSLVAVIVGIWAPDPSKNLEMPDMSNLRLVRVEDGTWGRKYIYESDREL